MRDHMDVDTSTLKIPIDVQESWQKSIDLIAKLVNIPAALIMRVHHKEIEVFKSSESHDNPYERGEMASLGTGLYCETVMQSRRMLLVPNALVDPDWDTNPDIELNMISYVGLPIIWPNGDVFGTICMLDSVENSYNEQQIDLLAQFKELIEFSLRSIYETTLSQYMRRNNEVLEEERCRLNTLACTDSMTNICNRRGLFEQGEQLFEKLALKNRFAAVYMIDVDSFKTINDDYGHSVGDSAIRFISDKLKNLSRRIDLLARYGGDEFVFVTPVPSVDAAESIASRIVSAFHEGSMLEGSDSIPITVSVGACVVDTKKQTLQESIDIADEALLEAKQLGRNQWIISNSQNALSNYPA